MADDTQPDAPTDDVTDNPSPEDAETGTADDTDWKSYARKHESDNKKLRKENERLKAEHQTAEEKALEAAKAEGRTEAQAELGLALLTAQIENAVLRSEDARKLADPSDALVFLKPEDVTDDGTVNPKKIAKAIDDLIAQKPHLAATATPRVPAGARNGSEGAGSDMNSLLRQAAGRGV